jgi:hypothetical protein
MESEEKYARAQVRRRIMWAHRLLPTERKTEVTGHRKSEKSTPRKYITSSLNLSVKKIETSTSGRRSLNAITRCQNNLYNRQLKMMHKHIVNAMGHLISSTFTKTLSAHQPSHSSAKSSFGDLYLTVIEQSVCRPIKNLHRKRDWNIRGAHACVRACMKDRRCPTTSTPMMGTKEVSETTDLDPHTARLTVRVHSSEVVQS